MKKQILTFLAVLIATVAQAVPAMPGLFKYVQPDGSVVMLRHHGDEFFHWTTDASGQCMVLGQDGYYRPGSVDPVLREEARQRRARANQLRVAPPRTHTDNIMTHGERHIPVFLVQFPDKQFKISDPEAQFSALLNQEGYSTNGGTGSVQDYFRDNSHGLFKPVFDVYPIVTLAHQMAYYGDSKNNRAPEAVIEAAKAVDSQVDFSQYDVDNDGYVDMCLMYYAGYNEAEGGPEETIWPHQWSVPNSPRFDGKYLKAYFCTSELKGNSGVRMCGIGTTCHEFGHSLGLPDFYDTDYEENGYCGGLYDFSIMNSGSYLNDSRTPPYYNAVERLMLGWMISADIAELPIGECLIKSVQNDLAYRTLTETEGEFFLYEYRDGTGWDTYLPKGLVVYHADQSTVRSVGGLTPRDQWVLWTSYNKINAYGDHPCFYVVPAADPSSLDFRGSTEEMVFPGSRSVRTFTPMDWNRNSNGISLNNIRLEGEGVVVNTRYMDAYSLVGKVMDIEGSPLVGARITVSPYEEASQTASPHLRVVARSQKVLETVTDGNGEFSLDVSELGVREILITASKWGYNTKSQKVSLSSVGSICDFYLIKEGESDVRYIYAYDRSSSEYYCYGNYSCMGSIRIPASELQRYTGYRFTSAELFVNVDNHSEEVAIICDIGSQRVLNYVVPENLVGYSMVDLTPADFTIPEKVDGDMYVGYGVKKADYQYPLVFTPGSGNLYIDYSYNPRKSSWQQMGGYDLYFVLGVTYDPNGGGHEEPKITLADMGYSTIDPGEGPWKDGETLLFTLVAGNGKEPVSVKWFCDGISQLGSSILLRSGSHRISASVVYADGSEEELETLIQVQ